MIHFYSTSTTLKICKKTEKLQSQRLVQPQKLELSPVSQNILLDNIHIFNANGFEFEIGDEIKLKTVPISKNTIFGKSDVDELLHILNEGSALAQTFKEEHPDLRKYVQCLHLELA